MRYYQRSRPKGHRLAKNVPSKGMHGYLPELDAEHRYWVNRKNSAFNLADPASHAVANNLLQHIGDLRRLSRLWSSRRKPSNENAENWTRWNNIRVEMLGVIALSRLCHDIYPPESLQHIGEAGPPREGEDLSGMVLIEPLLRDDDARPLDARIHVSAAVADILFGVREDEQPNTWYQREDNGLYVLRVTPADPTTPFLLTLMGSGVRADFSEMQTLMPYLPSQ